MGAVLVLFGLTISVHLLSAGAARIRRALSTAVGGESGDSARWRFEERNAAVRDGWDNTMMRIAERSDRVQLGFTPRGGAFLECNECGYKRYAPGTTLPWVWGERLEVIRR